MVMARGAFLEAIHLPALFFILGDVLVSLAIGGMSRRDGTLLLLTSLAQQRAQAFDLELELATVVAKFRDRFRHLFVLVLPVVELAVGVVAALGDGADLGLGESKLFAEIGELRGVLAVLVAVLFLFADQDLVALSQGVHFRADLSDGQLCTAQGLLKDGDLAMSVGTLAALIFDVLLELVPLNDQYTMLLESLVHGLAEFCSLHFHISELLLYGHDLPLDVLVLERDLTDARISLL